MRVPGSLALLAIMCCAGSAQNAAFDQDQSAEPDSQPIVEFRVQVRSAFQRENFRELENIAASAASTKARFAGGGWKLRTFYLTLQGPGSLTASDSRWTAHIARLERWAATMANSAVPRIALATSYTRYAWKARGNGWAKTVTEDSWKAFDDRIRQARTVLEQAQSLPNRDPQWFVAMQTVALAQGWPQVEAATLADTASAAAPEYFYIYSLQVRFLLPKWHGKPGEAAAFLDNAANQVGGKQGDAIYFQVASIFNCCRSSPEAPELSWDRIKSGFAAVEELHTSTNHQRNQIAFMALRAGDKQFAEQMFSRIGDDWDETVWRGKPKFEHAKSTLSLPAAAETEPVSDN